MKHKLYILSIIFCATFAKAHSQNFTSKAKVDAVQKSDYYKINLNSTITGIAQNNFTDLRLFDNDGVEIPYLLKKEKETTSTDQYRSFNFTQVKNENGLQIVTVQNPNEITLSALELRMANADANRQISISGSNDAQDWFVVKDKFYFTNAGKDNSSEIYRVVEFPQTKYAYYKIEIVNKNKDALFIRSIGQTVNSTTQNALQTITNFTYKIIDSSDKNTYIFCKAFPANSINRINFFITEPSMYLRKCRLIKNEVAVDDERMQEENESLHSSYKQNKQAIENVIRDFEINSNQNGVMPCADIIGLEKTDSFTIIIENKNDAPLQIKSIVAQQIPSNIIAKLEPNKTYYLYFGDATIEAPQYDLQYFESKLPIEIAAIKTGDVIAKTIKTKDEYNGKKDTYIVWIGLAIISAILLYLTNNMMKKMKEEK
jgi:hypothetical protein